MKPHFSLAFTLAAGIALAGCDWASGGSSSDTQMKNVEILPGTASDEMVTLDQASGDGTALDPSSAVGPVTKAADDAADKTGEEAASADGAADGAENPEAEGLSPTTPRAGDVIIRPPTGAAEPTKRQ